MQSCFFCRLTVPATGNRNDVSVAFILASNDLMSLFGTLLVITNANASFRESLKLTINKNHYIYEH